MPASVRCTVLESADQRTDRWREENAWDSFRRLSRLTVASHAFFSPVDLSSTQRCYSSSVAAVFDVPSTPLQSSLLHPLIKGDAFLAWGYQQDSPGRPETLELGKHHCWGHQSAEEDRCGDTESKINPVHRSRTRHVARRCVMKYTRV
jgi:hypothetical protein